MSKYYCGVIPGSKQVIQIGDAKPTKWHPITQVLVNPEQELAHRYGFAADNGLFEVIDYIRNLATRDLMPDWTSDSFVSARRSASERFDLIQVKAAELQDIAESLTDLIRLFEQDTSYLPSLLATFIDLDFGTPDSLLVPDTLDSISRFAKDNIFREKLISYCIAIASIPRLKPEGPADHIVLKKAVRCCREYWKGLGRSWTYEMLEVAEAGDDLTILEREAERFLVDALGSVGFDFELPDLKRAWLWR